MNAVHCRFRRAQRRGRRRSQTHAPLLSLRLLVPPTTRSTSNPPEGSIRPSRRPAKALPARLAKPPRFPSLAFPLQPPLLSLERPRFHVPTRAAAAHGGVHLPRVVRAGYGPGDRGRPRGGGALVRDNGGGGRLPAALPRPAQAVPRPLQGLWASLSIYPSHAGGGRGGPLFFSVHAAYRAAVAFLPGRLSFVKRIGCYLLLAVAEVSPPSGGARPGSLLIF